MQIRLSELYNQVSRKVIQRPLGAPRIMASSYINGVGPNPGPGATGIHETLRGFNGVFKYVLDLNYCALPVALLMDPPRPQECSVWWSNAHC
jgi:hypothetical protein